MTPGRRPGMKGLSPSELWSVNPAKQELLAFSSCLTVGAPGFYGSLGRWVIYVRMLVCQRRIQCRSKVNETSTLHIPHVIYI